MPSSPSSLPSAYALQETVRGNPLAASKAKSHNLHLHNNDTNNGAIHHLLSIIASPSYQQNTTTPAADGISLPRRVFIFVPFFKTRISVSIHRDTQCLFLEADFLMAKHNTLRKEENPTRDTNILAGTLEEILTF
jgi:hypothetical protein